MNSELGTSILIGITCLDIVIGVIVICYHTCCPLRVKYKNTATSKAIQVQLGADNLKAE